MLTANPSSEPRREAAADAAAVLSFHRALLLRVLMALLLATPAHGQDDGAAPPGEAVAGALDREIAALRRELQEIESAEADLARQVEILGTREALSRRLWLKASAARDAVSGKREEEERLAAELRASTETARVRARGALREAYKQGGMAGYASLLSVQGPSDLLRGLHHLDALARRQIEAVTTFEQRRAESERAAENLRRRAVELEAAAAQAEREQENLARDRRERLALLERLRKDRGYQESAISELVRASEQLAAAIQSLPSGSPAPRPSIAFSRLRGALPRPAKGSIAVPFGPIRHPRYGTVTPHPGLDILVEPGAPVRAVGAGRVVFSRRYGGYGRTVVIDHGERYLSVYARLAATSVSEGDDLLPGQEIGFAGEADEGGKSSVYFELRHQGKAIDPAGWLRGLRDRPASRGGSR